MNERARWRVKGANIEDAHQGAVPAKTEVDKSGPRIMVLQTACMSATARRSLLKDRRRSLSTAATVYSSFCRQAGSNKIYHAAV